MTSTAQQFSSLDSFGDGLGATIIRKGDAEYDKARRVAIERCNSRDTH